MLDELAQFSLYLHSFAEALGQLS
jgi:hypothetical protein